METIKEFKGLWWKPEDIENQNHGDGSTDHSEIIDYLCKKEYE